MVSVNFWTGKDGKDGQNGECAKVTLWFIHQVIDLKRTTFHRKNKLFTYLSNIRKLISFYAGKDGRDGINGDVVIYSK